MSNLTQWAGGSLNANSVAFQNAFAPADLAGLAAGSSVMSSIAFNNAASLDQFADFSFVAAITSSTIGQGQGFGVFLAILQGDNVTYGDGRLIAGTQAVYSPLLNSFGGFPIQTGTTITALSGSVLSQPLPPRSFRFVLQNNTLIALTSGMGYLSSYRQNTNS